MKRFLALSVSVCVTILSVFVLISNEALAYTKSYNVSSVNITKGFNTGGNLASLTAKDSNTYDVADEFSEGYITGPNRLGTAYEPYGPPYQPPMQPMEGESPWIPNAQCVLQGEWDCINEYSDGNPYYTDGDYTMISTPESYGEMEALYNLTNPDDITGGHWDNSVLIDFVDMRVTARRSNLLHTEPEFGFALDWYEGGTWWYRCIVQAVQLQASWTFYHFEIPPDSVSEACSLRGEGIYHPTDGWNETRLNQLRIYLWANVSGFDDIVQVSTAVVYVQGWNSVSGYDSVAYYTFNGIESGYNFTGVDVNCTSDGAYTASVFVSPNWYWFTGDVCDYYQGGPKQFPVGIGPIPAVISLKIEDFRNGVNWTMFTDMMKVYAERLPRAAISTDSAWWIVWVMLVTFIALVPLALYWFIKGRRQNDKGSDVANR